MTLEELKDLADQAVASFEVESLEPIRRLNDAFDQLSRVTGHRGDLTGDLRTKFDAAWSAYNLAGKRIDEILSNQGRFTLYGPEEFATCRFLTREFARAVHATILYGMEPKAPPPAADPDPEIAHQDEQDGRAAADE